MLVRALCKEGHISNLALCHFADSDQWMDGCPAGGGDGRKKVRPKAGPISRTLPAAPGVQTNSEVER